MPRGRNPIKPKRYQSAYMLFLGDFRRKNQQRGYSNIEMVEKGARLWRILSLPEKQPYEIKSQKLKTQYERESKNYLTWRKAHPSQENKGQSEKRSRKYRDPNKPKKPLTAYMLFIQDFRRKNGHRGWEVTEMVRQGASVWKTLNNREKAPYESTAQNRLVKYRKQMQTYLNYQKKMATKITAPKDRLQSSSSPRSSKSKSSKPTSKPTKKSTNKSTSKSSSKPTTSTKLRALTPTRGRPKVR